MATTFKLPDLGEGVHEGQIVRVMVKPGDTIAEDQPLMEVETDKAAVVIPSPFAGTVEKVHVRDGQMVHVGDVMVTFGTSPLPVGEGSGVRAARATNARIGPAHETGTPSPQPSPKGRGSGARRTPASPAVRKLARSLNVDIDSINGTGPGGRVQRADVEMAAGSTPSPSKGEGWGEGRAPAVSKRPVPQEHSTLTPPLSLKGRGSTPTHIPAVAAKVDYSPLPDSLIIEPPGEAASDSHGPIKRSPLTQARKTIANVMVQSWTTIPHATDFDDADVTELEQLRKGYTPPDAPHRKITLLAFVIRAVVRGLQRFPEFNAHFDAERGEIIYKRYINIAIGVHTERGLVPMVLRDTDHMTIPQISEALNVIGEKARTATFAVNDTRGGTYTISNAGAMGGSRYSTPIITPGQAAVLAIGRSRWMPWVIEHENGQRGLAPRLIMPLSHSIDHRLLDGGQEVQFMQQVVGDLQNPARLLL
jgi:pyruvate/2-oxoglutarate dehydrogenase complex dihydrolipoamide acyltransferase (E2) component